MGVARSHPSKPNLQKSFIHVLFGLLWGGSRTHQVLEKILIGNGDAGQKMHELRDFKDRCLITK